MFFHYFRSNRGKIRARSLRIRHLCKIGLIWSQGLVDISILKCDVEVFVLGKLLLERADFDNRRAPLKVKVRIRDYLSKYVVSYLILFLKFPLEL